MRIEPLGLKGLFLIEPKRHGDARGFFSETYSQKVFDEIAPGTKFVQDNHSLSQQKGVLRGLHFQRPPYAQGKLVRVTRGAVLDVAVDIRQGSPTYGEHIAVELSADNWRQLWIPEGFAHAFCTLTEETEFAYKVTNYYAPDHDDGILFSSKELGIVWPFPSEELILSDKDRALKDFSTLVSPFAMASNAGEVETS